jgi:putative oxidoreductase
MRPTKSATSSAAQGMPHCLERWGTLYARIALGTAFLSAVASRFGLWHGAFNMNHFSDFISYTAQVNSFLPEAAAPYLAWAATVAETSLGILLICGYWLRWVSLGTAVLLVVFGTAMAISFGPKSPLDYSVFSASGAAILLSLYASQSRSTQSSADRMEDHHVDETR